MITEGLYWGGTGDLSLLAVSIYLVIALGAPASEYSPYYRFWDRPTGSERNNRGVDLLQRGRVKEALVEMEAAFSEDPTNPVISSNIATVYLTQYGLVEAIKGWPRDEIYERAQRHAYIACQYAKENRYVYWNDYAQNVFMGSRVLGVDVDFTVAQNAYREALRWTSDSNKRFGCWIGIYRASVELRDWESAKAALDNAEEELGAEKEEERAVSDKRAIIQRRREDVKHLQDKELPEKNER